MSTRHYKQDDRLPVYEAILIKGAKDPIDLTDAVGVELWLRNMSTGVLKVSAAGAIVAPATDGRVRYEWGVDDLDTPGDYEVSWKVEFDGSRILTAPSDALDTVVVDADPPA